MPFYEPPTQFYEWLQPEWVVFGFPQDTRAAQQIQNNESIIEYIEDTL